MATLAPLRKNPGATPETSVPDVLPEPNGGFPEPAPNQAFRAVSAVHAECGRKTRIRIPGSLDADSVRRVSCAGCGRVYRPEKVDQVHGPRVVGRILRMRRPRLPRRTQAELRLTPEALAPRVGNPARSALAGVDPTVPDTIPASWTRRRPGKIWALVSLPIAAGLVIGALTLLQSDNQTEPGSSATPISDIARNAEFIEAPEYSIALPPGWGRAEAPNGATLAAVAADQGADAVLWISRDPSLELDAFQERTLKQLSKLAPNARIVERIVAPSQDGTTVRMRADGTDDTGSVTTYEVTLRAVGPLRYYLATTLYEGAGRQSVDGIELLHGSFLPTGQGEAAGELPE